MVDSSCFLVSAKPSFYPVFGQFWTQIGPKCLRRFFVGLKPTSQCPVGSEQYQKFGKLRNASIHFAVPDDRDVQCETLKFLFEVMQPLVYDFWKESIVLHASDWDDYIWEKDDGLRSQIERCGIEITAHLEAALDRESYKRL